QGSGNQFDLHYAHLMLGHAALARGDLASAEEYYQYCWAIAEQVGDNDRGPPFSLFGLGHVALQRGELAGAQRTYGRALAAAERHQQQPGVAGAWLNLGVVACEQGRWQVAAGCCRTARHMARRMRIIDVEALASVGQARAILRHGPTGTRRQRLVLAL